MWCAFASSRSAPLNTFGSLCALPSPSVDCFLCRVERDYYDYDGEWEARSEKKVSSWSGKRGKKANGNSNSRFFSAFILSWLSDGKRRGLWMVCRNEMRLVKVSKGWLVLFEDFAATPSAANDAGVKLFTARETTNSCRACFYWLARPTFTPAIIPTHFISWIVMFVFDSPSTNPPLWKHLRVLRILEVDWLDFYVLSLEVHLTTSLLLRPSSRTSFNQFPPHSFRIYTAPPPTLTDYTGKWIAHNRCGAGEIFQLPRFPVEHVAMLSGWQKARISYPLNSVALH